MEYIIKTPVEGFTGYSASLYFLHGEAHTSDEKLVKWFRKHNYIVIEPEKPKATTRKKKTEENKDV